MASTQPVNFRADSTFYQQTKEILADEKLTLSDIFNAALRVGIIHASNIWLL